VPESVSDNKRIAKNTIYLYIRMFITMAIGLLTSRVVLNALGVSDYGLNNLVAGVVSLFLFLRTSLAQGTQRYLNFSQGTGRIEESQKVFSTSILLYITYAVMIAILTEVVGLYLIHHSLTIDEGRMNAALVAFHLYVLGTAIAIIISPFFGCIIAHEKMSFVAYSSIIDVVFKLLIVYLLLMVDDVDKLIMYSILYFFVGVLNFSIIYFYCRTHFIECRFSRKFVIPSLRKELLAFSGWSVLGSMAGMGAGQGISIILNVFYNTTINAARGIAMTVSGHIDSFISNFQMAANPQIVKLYANGDANGMMQLANNTSKFSAYLYILLAIPIFLEIDYILYIWLGMVPDYTPYFARVAIIQSLLTCMNSPHGTAVGATGRIKWLNILVGSVLLLTLPITYILLKNHVGLEIVYAVNVIPWVFVGIIRVELLRHYVQINTMEVYRRVYLKVLGILLLCYIPLYALHIQVEYGLLRLVIIVGVSLIWSALVIYWLGLPKHIRRLLLERIVIGGRIRA